VITYDINIIVIVIIIIISLFVTSSSMPIVIGVAHDREASFLRWVWSQAYTYVCSYCGNVRQVDLYSTVLHCTVYTGWPKKV